MVDHDIMTHSSHYADASTSPSCKNSKIVTIDSQISKRRWWLPLAVVAVTLVITGFLWNAIRVQEETHIQRTVEAESYWVCSTIRSHLDTRIVALKRMAERWEVRGTPQRDQWELDAANYVRDFGDFKAIEWVDPGYYVRWVVPLEGNEQAADMYLGFEAHRRAALEAAEDSLDVTMSKPIDLVQGGKGLLVYCPIHNGQIFEGFILGVFRIEEMLASTWKELREENFEAQIIIGDLPIISHASGDKNSQWKHEASMTLYGVPWRVALVPSDHLLAKIKSPLSNVSLAIGSTLAILLGLVTHLGQTAQARADIIDDTNAHLLLEAAERKQAQEQFRLVVESSPSGLIMVDRRGTIVLVNEQTETWFGYTRQELIGQPIEILVPQRYRQRHAQLVEEFFLDPSFRPMGLYTDLYGQRKDGSEIPLDISLNPIQTEKGVMVLTSVADITDRKRAEQELRASELRKSAILDTALDCVVTIDHQGKIIEFNPAAEKTFGYTRDQAIGQTLAEMIIPPELREAHTQGLKRYLATRDIRVIGKRLELTAQHSDGHIFPVELAISVVNTEGGPPVFTGFLRDISQRKQAEKELSEHAASLENLTMDLSRRNKELDEFTYVASHDLQEPLRKLISFSKLLTKDVGDGLSDQAQTDLKYITEAADRMQHLVQDLLSLSRAARTEMETTPVSMSLCVEQAIEALDERIKNTEAEIACDVLPEVQGDKTLLIQLYQNLICNALKYCRDKPILHLTVERGPSGLIFGVRDNGIGIKQEYQEQIFAPFKRLHGKSEYEGTGIGLATCRKVVERHGGRIWVESAPGEGSHFKFTLNAKRKAAA